MIAKDLYYVAVKAFLTNKGKLFIFKDGFGNWDLPGGRIREDEFSKPLEKVLARKIREELGNSIRYKLGRPVVFMWHERMEHLPGGRLEKRRIFAVGYETKFLGGTVKLASHHTEYRWIPLKGFRPREYFIGGWRRGVEEYLVRRNKK